MDPIQVGLGILIGMAVVIAILGAVIAIGWFSDRGQRSENDEAIEATRSRAIRQHEEHVRATKESSSRPG